MTSCLGLFVENNLIKYAKISKERENVKIDNYGIKMYEQDVEKNIEQIINETFSYKDPICINTVNEKYTNTEIFSLLSDVDSRKSIKTEFEYFCNETGKNKLTLEYRAVMSDADGESEQKKVLYAYTEKGNIAERIQLLDGHRVSNLSPVSIAIMELEKDFNENSLIINIENRTEITTIVNNTPVKVDIIETGMNEILKQIAERENSITKAYEICKNTTLYTASGQDLKDESSDYLEIIIPIIYRIVEETKKIIEKNNINIKKIYLSGTAIAINNIDLYFQENFLNYKCEILAPYFVDKTNLRLNIKDYIEVNSAIALAMQFLNKKHQNTNFNSKMEKWQKFQDLLKADVGFLSKNKEVKEPKKIKTIKINNVKDIGFVRFTYTMISMLIIYVAISLIIYNQIDEKTKLAQEVIDDTKSKIQTIAKYNSLISSRTQNYEQILKQVNEANEKYSEINKTKNVIPNLLNQIMFAIPKEAQILSIENTEDKHIKIVVQSNEYQYLGYFKSEIQNRVILTNVISTSGTRDENDLIQINIEGDLPY